MDMSQTFGNTIRLQIPGNRSRTLEETIADQPLHVPEVSRDMQALAWGHFTRQDPSALTITRTLTCGNISRSLQRLSGIRKRNFSFKICGNNCNSASL